MFLPVLLGYTLANAVFRIQDCLVLLWLISPVVGVCLLICFDRSYDPTSKNKNKKQTQDAWLCFCVRSSFVQFLLD
jgi:hypothetical protein